MTFENTLILEFLYIDSEQLRQIMDEILAALNQSSILVEKQLVECYFYEGN